MRVALAVRHLGECDALRARARDWPRCARVAQRLEALSVACAAGTEQEQDERGPSHSENLSADRALRVAESKEVRLRGRYVEVADERTQRQR